ncbi:MAG: ExbD/TolR family protein [Prevotella sp.]
MPTFKRKRRRSFLMINTASLPDLIFTVLFFFMMSTHMRDENKMIRYDEPRGSELAVFNKKPWMVNMYIGMPSDKNDVDKTEKIRIQLNDRFVQPDEIEECISRYASSLSDEMADELTVVIKADKDVPMSVIGEVRNSLRKADVRKIIFSASNGNNKLMQK